MQFEPITVENAGDGALAEQFAAAVEEVLRDLKDPSKDPGAERRITLTVALSQSEGSGSLAVTVASDVKLARRKAVRTHAAIDQAGRLLQYRDGQLGLPLNVEPFPHPSPATNEEVLR